MVICLFGSLSILKLVIKMKWLNPFMRIFRVQKYKEVKIKRFKKRIKKQGEKNDENRCIR